MCTGGKKPEWRLARLANILGKTMTEKSKNPVGRPTKYNEEVASDICRRLIRGESIRQMTRLNDDLPCEDTVYAWLQTHQDFSEKYVRAKVLQADRMAEEILEISDDGTNDWIERENKDGSKQIVLDHEHVSRSKLRTDSRKWLMSKMAPVKYGDKVQQDHISSDGSMKPTTIIIKGPDEK